MLRALVKQGVVPFRWVTCDEHFGQNTAFLDGVAALDKRYMAEVPITIHVWLTTPRVQPPGHGPKGRPRTRPRVSLKAADPQALCDVAAQLPKRKWRRYVIKEGSKGPICADFAFLRVTTVRDELPGPRVWAVFRRSLAPQPELKTFLCNAPVACAHLELVRLTGLRWPIETALEEGKGEVGMDHYETRTWRGWHHHITQSFLAHFFLVRMRIKLKKAPAMTIAQARDLIASAHRRTDSTFTDTIAIVRYRQHRNYAAYRSHRKRTLARHHVKSAPTPKNR